MKRLLLAVTLLASVLALLVAIGWKKGNECPPFVGYACFELNHGEETPQILRFIENATQGAGDTDLQQKRWPGAESAEQATHAYRASLSYSITKGQGNPRLHVWCIASSGITAVDGPVFPGRLARGAQYGVPSFQKGPSISFATQTTAVQKILFGLGMFPPGTPLPLEPVG